MSQKAELDRCDWHFDSVTSQEIESCFVYEYAREVAKGYPRIAGLIKRWRAGERAARGSSERRGGTRALIEFYKAMRLAFPDFIPVSPSWFPHESWQELGQKLRARLVRDLHGGIHHHWQTLPYDKLTIHTLRELEAPNVISMPGFQFIHEAVSQHDLSKTEYGFFAINWDYPDPEIRRAFAKWLAEQRKNRRKQRLPQPRLKPRGRGSFKDRLRWLGALRIRDHYRKKELVDYNDSNLKVDAPYSHLPALNDAAKKARRLMGVLIRAAETT